MLTRVLVAVQLVYAVGPTLSWADITEFRAAAVGRRYEPIVHLAVQRCYLIGHFLFEE